MKRTAMLIFAAGILASCGGESNLENELEKAIDEAVEASTETEEESSNDETVAYEDGKVFSVADFTALFEKDAASLKEKTVTIEGYYLNYNSQEGSNGKEYTVTLYDTEACEFKGKQVFFFLTTKSNDELNKLTQHSKVKISGKVTGEKFFSAPEIADAKIVK